MSAAVSESIPVEPEKKPETLLAILFGIAAIATAFSSFQASKLSGDVIAGYNEGIRKANEVSQLNSEGNQVVAVDQSLFFEWSNADELGQDAYAQFIYEDLMNGELREAIDWWANSPASTPFTEKNTEYDVAQFTEAEALNEEVDEHFATAAKLDEEGEKFDLITVLLAVTLFFLGLSTVMRKRATRSGVLAIGATALAISIGALLILMI